MAIYQYRPVDPQRNEIRLLQLEDLPECRGTATARTMRLQCRMIHTSLRFDSSHGSKIPNRRVSGHSDTTWLANSEQPNPEYYALSYVWGDPAPVEDIEIDGKDLKIPRNLAEALISILENTQYRVIWADAICIDQSDNIEKSWQVQQMVHVYAHASAVISWLGRSTENSGQALCDLQNIYNMLMRAEVPRSSDSSTVRDFVYNAIEDFCNHNTLAYDAIKDIYQRPYWSRIWILQELAVARNCIFVCGNQISRGLDVTLIALTTHGSHPNTGLQVWNGEPSRFDVVAPLAVLLQPYRKLKFICGARWASFSPTLFNLLLVVSIEKLESSDSRDFVYALLGIASDSKTINITPDYSQNSRVLYMSLARRLISLGYIETITLACGKENPNLPSWVPDWSKKIPERIRNGLGPPVSDAPITNVAGISENEIALSGSIVDRIASIMPSWDCPPQSEPPDWTDWWSQVVETLQAWLLTTERTFHKPTDELAAIAVADYDLVSRTQFGSNLIPAYEEAKTHDSSLGLRNFSRWGLCYFTTLFTYALEGYRMFQSTSGRSGLINTHCKKGDLVVVFRGVSAPCILRPVSVAGCINSTSDETRYQLVGVAYVHGIMTRGSFGQDSPLSPRNFILC